MHEKLDKHNGCALNVENELLEVTKSEIMIDSKLKAQSPQMMYFYYKKV